MKKILIIAMIVTTLVVVVMAVSALAGTITPTVAVTGTVSGVCKAGVSGNLAFTIDPSQPGPIAATVTNATVFCSNGTPFTVTAASLNYGGAAASCGGGGITGTLQTGTNTMNYTFTCTGSGTGQGHGSGKDVNLGIGGSIAAASYQNAAVSNLYADTVTLTITY